MKRKKRHFTESKDDMTAFGGVLRLYWYKSDNLTVWSTYDTSGADWKHRITCWSFGHDEFMWQDSGGRTWMEGVNKKMMCA